MEFIEAKKRFAAAINRLSISQNDKYAIMGIVEFINPEKATAPKKKEVKRVDVIPTGRQSIRWHNNEKFDTTYDIRVVSKFLLTDKIPVVGDIVIDDNEVHYKITGLEKDGDIVVLSIIK